MALVKVGEIDRGTLTKLVESHRGNLIEVTLHAAYLNDHDTYTGQSQMSLLRGLIVVRSAPSFSVPNLLHSHSFKHFLPEFLFFFQPTIYSNRLCGMSR